MHPMLLDIPTSMTSKRLTVRQYRAGDGDGFFILLVNNIEHLRDELDEINTIKSIEDAEIRLRQLTADWGARTRFVLAVCDKETERQIGQIWIESVDWKVPSLEIGWFIEKKSEGKQQ